MTEDDTFLNRLDRQITDVLVRINAFIRKDDKIPGLDFIQEVADDITEYWPIFSPEAKSAIMKYLDENIFSLGNKLNTETLIDEVSEISYFDFMEFLINQYEIVANLKQGESEISDSLSLSDIFDTNIASNVESIHKFHAWLTLKPSEPGEAQIKDEQSISSPEQPKVRSEQPPTELTRSLDRAYLAAEATRRTIFIDKLRHECAKLFGVLDNLDNPSQADRNLVKIRRDSLINLSNDIIQNWHLFSAAAQKAAEAYLNKSFYGMAESSTDNIGDFSTSQTPPYLTTVWLIDKILFERFPSINGNLSNQILHTKLSDLTNPNFNPNIKSPAFKAVFDEFRTWLTEQVGLPAIFERSTLIGRVGEVRNNMLEVPQLDELQIQVRRLVAFWRQSHPEDDKPGLFDDLMIRPTQAINHFITYSGPLNPVLVKGLRRHFEQGLQLAIASIETYNPGIKDYDKAVDLIVPYGYEWRYSISPTVLEIYKKDTKNVISPKASQFIKDETTLEGLTTPFKTSNIKIDGTSVLQLQAFQAWLVKLD